tara:strand:+ start:1636 stop:2025 length:390 start_codon:yes stop_codon:yes gene_type:complete
MSNIGQNRKVYILPFFLFYMEIEKSIFLRIFGDSPILRVLDFLVTFSMYDYSMTDIAKNADVGYTTLKLFWKDLVRNEIVVQTRVVGKAKMYKLNGDSEIVKQFLVLYNLVLEKETEKILNEESKTVKH